jgi:hypothetical protein
MKQDPEDDRRRLEAFFRDELRRGSAESPSFDDVAAYIEDRLDPEQRAALEERMAGDPTLRQEAEDLRVLRAQMLSSRPAATRRRPFALAGLAAAAAVAAVAFWLGTPRERRPVENGTRPPVAAAPVATLKDGDLRLTLSADGAVSGLPAVDPKLRDAIGGALRGALRAPQGLDSLRSGPLTLLGGTSVAAAFAPVTPLGTRVASDRPAFRWAAYPNARSYEVSVFDQDLQKRAGSGPIAGTHWTPERPLPRGRTYLWQVTALTARGRVIAPAPPAPEARFEVVDAGVLAKLEQQRAGAPGSRLLAAIVFSEAGLLDDADVELQALAADNPGSPQLDRLREALRDLRRPR